MNTDMNVIGGERFPNRIDKPEAGLQAPGKQPPSLRDLGIKEIVIVDSSYDKYDDFVQSARAGQVGLQFCVDGRSAIRLARRFRADMWLISTDLPDMSGFDLLDMLAPRVMQGDVDPQIQCSRRSLDRVSSSRHAGVFIVSTVYRMEDEQTALSAGVSGYLVRPVTLDLIRATREPSAAEQQA